MFATGDVRETRWGASTNSHRSNTGCRRDGFREGRCQCRRFLDGKTQTRKELAKVDSLHSTVAHGDHIPASLHAAELSVKIQSVVISIVERTEDGIGLETRSEHTRGTSWFNPD